MAGRVDVERSCRAAMGASNAGAMAGGVDRVRGKCAARLPLQRDLVSDGIGAMCRVDSPPAQRCNEACTVPAARG